MEHLNVSDITLLCYWFKAQPPLWPTGLNMAPHRRNTRRGL